MSREEQGLEGDSQR